MDNSWRAKRRQIATTRWKEWETPGKFFKDYHTNKIFKLMNTKCSFAFVSWFFTMWKVKRIFSSSSDLTRIQEFNFYYADHFLYDGGDGYNLHWRADSRLQISGLTKTCSGHPLPIAVCLCKSCLKVNENQSRRMCRWSELV